MGVLFTTQYFDMEENEWKTISNSPAIFECISDNTSIEIDDINHRNYKLKFRKGAKLTMTKVLGQHRLIWDDKDII